MDCNCVRCFALFLPQCIDTVSARCRASAKGEDRTGPFCVFEAPNVEACVVGAGFLSVVSWRLHGADDLSPDQEQTSLPRRERVGFRSYFGLPSRLPEYSCRPSLATQCGYLPLVSVVQWVRL